jgi:LmbE family N-acetylglucosaminyl deacetylase
MLNLPAGPITAILAHPDDIKCVTGTVLMAMEKNAEVSLILLTKGEALDLRIDPIKMGTGRIKELRGFLKEIKIPEANFFQLGVPDGSAVLPALRDDFYRTRGEPYRDDLLKTNQVPYRDAHKPGMPFFGEALVATLKGLLEKLKPAVILTHHPRDAHADHRAVSFFARQARAGLKPAAMPKAFFALVYAQGLRWPPKGEYFYSRAIARKYPGLQARQVMLPQRIFLMKKRACRKFMPILGTAYIKSNMKRDEVLWSWTSPEKRESLKP